MRITKRKRKQKLQRKSITNTFIKKERKEGRERQKESYNRKTERKL